MQYQVIFWLYQLYGGVLIGSTAIAESASNSCDSDRSSRPGTLREYIWPRYPPNYCFVIQLSPDNNKKESLVRKTFRWEGDRPISIEDVPSTPHPPPRPHHLDARPRPPRREARPSRPDGPRGLSVGRRGATAPCFLGGDIYGRRASHAT